MKSLTRKTKGGFFWGFNTLRKLYDDRKTIREKKSISDLFFRYYMPYNSYELYKKKPHHDPVYPSHEHQDEVVYEDEYNPSHEFRDLDYVNKEEPIYDESANEYVRMEKEKEIYNCLHHLKFIPVNDVEEFEDLKYGYSNYNFYIPIIDDMSYYESSRQILNKNFQKYHDKYTTKGESLIYGDTINIKKDDIIITLDGRKGKFVSKNGCKFSVNFEDIEDIEDIDISELILLKKKILPRAIDGGKTKRKKRINVSRKRK